MVMIRPPSSRDLCGVARVANMGQPCHPQAAWCIGLALDKTISFQNTKVVGGMRLAAEPHSSANLVAGRPIAIVVHETGHIAEDVSPAVLSYSNHGQ
jgi:hypothetical protein